MGSQRLGALVPIARGGIEGIVERGKTYAHELLDLLLLHAQLELAAFGLRKTVEGAILAMTDDDCIRGRNLTHPWLLLYKAKTEEDFIVSVVGSNGWCLLEAF
jgi:hypothetical protein